jgi:hypothetical protein
VSPYTFPRHPQTRENLGPKLATLRKSAFVENVELEVLLHYARRFFVYSLKFFFVRVH